MISDWLTNNYIEIFGTITGILYVFLEIRQNLWLWPVGIATSAAYIWIFLTGKLYADMSLQCYYLIISIIGWYWWVRGSEASKLPSPEGLGVGSSERGLSVRGSEASKLPSMEGQGVGIDGIDQLAVGREKERNVQVLPVSRLKIKTGLILFVVWIVLYILMYQLLKRFTDSPVPQWDSLITSLSVVATWMLARKIFEHWYLWIVVNCIASFLFFSRGLYPTMVLYIIYGIMSVEGLRQWKKSLLLS